MLFEPSTSEHVSARTIFDPITALAPGSDCQTYAIGYAYAVLQDRANANVYQIFEWIDPYCVVAASLHHFTYVDYCESPFPNR